MTIHELREKLLILSRRKYNESDPENDHIAADHALLEYINDPEVTRLFLLIDKWYS